MFASLTLAVVLIWVVQKTVEFYRNVKGVGNHPGHRTIFWSNHPLVYFLPPIPGLTRGTNYFFNKKYEVYKQTGWDIVACVTAFPAWSYFLIADPAVTKHITSARVSFPKAMLLYRALCIFGPNIVASEGDTWKKYRKISAPAFSDRNNRLVWEESLNITRDLINTVWKDKDVVNVEHVVGVTLPIALNVVGVAGFGRKTTWQADTVITPGHTMSFHDALQLVSSGIALKIIVPRWAMGLIARWAQIRAAFDELETYMLEMIRARRTAEKEERYDLFSSLLDANDDEGLLEGETKLTDRELLGNIFVFLLAGHETTAHTLAFTFALLALYPDQQEILYRHIKTVIPDGRNPTYEEMPLFTHSVAVFYETLRLFPPVALISKMSAEDTVLVSTNEAGQRRTIPVPQGTIVNIDVVGLHYNPRYWKDPEMFDPSRFLGDWPREAFVPFSQGPRACMGRKFFETEGVAVLTMLVSKYQITIEEKPGETFEERKGRILQTRAGITLTPIHMPLVFTRR
ncbi:cytochrome P450 [Armillaria gallica]|uniref:Cytochrome P450 n=1 Tax=Armillaria gallica TaxID=47427 RepID=A0A2H3DX68_ARMGA|nr:cytochrome P450 [Armillaria gallica]